LGPTTTISDEHQSKQSTKQSDQYEENWNTMFEGLLEYKARHGTFKVPRGFIHNGKNLGIWVGNQRERYSNAQEGKKKALSADRIEKMQRAGFKFGICKGPREYEQKWDDMLLGLAQFYNQYKRFRMPIGFMHGGKDFLLLVQESEKVLRK
jgi:hypothetical protein